MDLQTAREAVGWTQAEMDRRAKLTKGTTRDIETGRNKNPTIEVVFALIRALRRAGLEGLRAEAMFGGLSKHKNGSAAR